MRIVIALTVLSLVGCHWGGESDYTNLGIISIVELTAKSDGVSTASAVIAEPPVDRLSPEMRRAARAASMSEMHLLEASAVDVYFPHMSHIEGYNIAVVRFLVFNEGFEPIELRAFNIFNSDILADTPVALGVFQPDGTDHVYCSVDDLACTICGLSSPRAASKEVIGVMPEALTIPANSSAIVSCGFRIDELQPFVFRFEMQNGKTSWHFTAKYRTKK